MIAAPRLLFVEPPAGSLFQLWRLLAAAARSRPLRNLNARLTRTQNARPLLVTAGHRWPFQPMVWRYYTSMCQGTWNAGLAERSFGSPFKIQGKSQRVLEPIHYPCGKFANLA